jgi:hypothetical protein
MKAKGETDVVEGEKDVECAMALVWHDPASAELLPARVHVRKVVSHAANRSDLRSQKS